MKKFFTLCIALFSAATMFAQEAKGIFEFTDENGNVIESGSVLTRNETEASDFGGLQINTGLYAKQNQTEMDGYKLGVKLKLDVTELPHGDIQYCFPGSCFTTSAVGEVITEGGLVENPDGITSLKTEWIMGVDPEDETEEKQLYGTAVVKLTLIPCKQIPAGEKYGVPFYDWEELGESTSVTVNFVYADPAGINGVADNANATVVARYAADGTHLSAPQKGLNIVKLSNGKTVKYVK